MIGSWDNTGCVDDEYKSPGYSGFETDPHY